MSDNKQATQQTAAQEALSAAYYEPDEIVIVIRGPMALQAAEKLGEVFQNLMSYQPRSRGGGGNWGKDGDERGLFKTVPAYQLLEVGDRFKTPVIGYSVEKGKTGRDGTQYPDKLILFSPYNVKGEYDPTKFGAKAGSIGFDSKKWKDIPFCVQGAEKFLKDGKVHPITLRVATWKIGADKDDPNKRFHFLLAVHEAESQDPDLLKYTDPASLKPAVTPEQTAPATDQTPATQPGSEDEIPY